MIGSFTGDGRFHSFVVFVGISHRYPVSISAARDDCPPNRIAGRELELRTNRYADGGWWLGFIPCLLGGFFVYFFSTLGNMAFHQGDFDDAAVNINIKYDYY